MTARYNSTWTFETRAVSLSLPGLLITVYSSTCIFFLFFFAEFRLRPPLTLLPSSGEPRSFLQPQLCRRRTAICMMDQYWDGTLSISQCKSKACEQEQNKNNDTWLYT